MAPDSYHYQSLLALTFLPPYKHPEAIQHTVRGMDTVTQAPKVSGMGAQKQGLNFLSTMHIGKKHSDLGLEFCFCEPNDFTKSVRSLKTEAMR